MTTDSFDSTHPNFPHCLLRAVSLFRDLALRVRFALVIMFRTDSRGLYPCFGSCSVYHTVQYHRSPLTLTAIP